MAVVENKGSQQIIFRYSTPLQGQHLAQAFGGVSVVGFIQKPEVTFVSTTAVMIGPFEAICRFTTVYDDIEVNTLFKVITEESFVQQNINTSHRSVGYYYDFLSSSGTYGEFLNLEDFGSYKQDAIYLPICDLLWDETFTTFAVDTSCQRNTFLLEVQGRLTEHCRVYPMAPSVDNKFRFEFTGGLFYVKDPGLPTQSDADTWQSKSGYRLVAPATLTITPPGDLTGLGYAVVYVEKNVAGGVSEDDLTVNVTFASPYTTVPTDITLGEARVPIAYLRLDYSITRRQAVSAEIIHYNVPPIMDLTADRLGTMANFCTGNSRLPENLDGRGSSFLEVLGNILLEDETAFANHLMATSVHGAVSTPTPSRLIIRDAAGRAQVEAPNDAKDIVNKTYADTLTAASFKPYGLGVSSDPGEAVVSNADTAFTTGFYRLPNGSTGNPFSADVILKVYRNGAGQIEQECTNPTTAITEMDNKLYRVYNGSWSAWSPIITGAYIDQGLKTTDSPNFARVRTKGRAIGAGPKYYKLGYSATTNLAWGSSFSTTSQAGNIQVAPYTVVGHWNSTATLFLYFFNSSVVETQVGSGYAMGTNGAQYCVPFAPSWNGSDTVYFLLLDRADNVIRYMQVLLSTGAFTELGSAPLTFSSNCQGVAHLYRHDQDVSNNVTFAHLSSADGLRTLRWNGSTIVQVGNTYTGFGSISDSQIDMDYLKDGYVCLTYRSSSDPRYMKVMKFDGTDWTEVYTHTMSSSAGAGAVKALTDTSFVGIDNTNESVYLYTLTLDDSVATQSSLGSPTTSSGDDAIVIRLGTGTAIVSDRSDLCARVSPSTYLGSPDGELGAAQYRGIYHANYPW